MNIEATLPFTGVTELRTKEQILISKKPKRKMTFIQGIAPCLKWQRGALQRQGTYMAILGSVPGAHKEPGVWDLGQD